MPKVVKNVFANFDGNAGFSSFQQSIRVPEFQPDEIIVRRITWFDNTSATQATYAIQSDLTGWQTLGAFNTTSNTYPIDAVFHCHGPVDNLYTFQILNAAGALTTVKGWISIQLEFVKHGYDIKHNQIGTF